MSMLSIAPAATDGAMRWRTGFSRGQNILREAKTVADQTQWPFSWRGAVISGVGHDARHIFTSDAAFAALAGFTAGRR
jgi:hypothetical protein